MTNRVFWKVCPECLGQGKKKRRIRKNLRIRYQANLEKFEKNPDVEPPPVPPVPHLFTCPNCTGSGLNPAEADTVTDFENFPKIAIIGGGIGGTALAVACLHRGIPFTLYERDTNFDSRSQGYGLTLQQASKAIDGFGLKNLPKGVVSTRHLVHTTDGKIVGEWGMRKWLESHTSSSLKKTNIHIARQSLRQDLLQQLGENNSVKWGHQLQNLTQTDNGRISLTFLAEGEEKCAEADLVVGADGIRSLTRLKISTENESPLRYLGCMVILGICSLEALEDCENSLLDSATVFQTANGNERIYMMPFDADTIMWQLSFPISEREAKKLNQKGPKTLKEEACRRTAWHSPIPQILKATAESQISGYPVYDRDLLSSDFFENAGAVTLIGDAAHPMSPFKGQGANQALLDALSLARTIYRNCRPQSSWREEGLRKAVLEDFEAEMRERSTAKVEDSAAAAVFLHSEIALFEGDEPRGRVLKRKKE